MIETYVQRRASSIRFALRGITYLLQTQPNARIHLAASVMVICAGLALRVSAPEWCWLIAAMAAVWIAESFNTALELLADALHPQHHPVIGRAKDLAAAAVLLAALAAMAIGVCVFGPHLV